MHRQVGQPSFAEALVQGGRNARLDRIAGLVDWAGVERLLDGIYASGTGRPAYPPLVLLKVLLLESWYGLGDPAMEEWVRTEEERLTTALEHILTRLT